MSDAIELNGPPSLILGVWCRKVVSEKRMDESRQTCLPELENQAFLRMHEKKTQDMKTS